MCNGLSTWRSFLFLWWSGMERRRGNNNAAAAGGESGNPVGISTVTTNVPGKGRLAGTFPSNRHKWAHFPPLLWDILSWEWLAESSVTASIGICRSAIAIVFCTTQPILQTADAYIFTYNMVWNRHPVPLHQCMIVWLYKDGYEWIRWIRTEER